MFHSETAHGFTAFSDGCALSVQEPTWLPPPTKSAVALPLPCWWHPQSLSTLMSDMSDQRVRRSCHLMFVCVLPHQAPGSISAIPIQQICAWETRSSGSTIAAASVFATGAGAVVGPLCVIPLWQSGMTQSCRNGQQPWHALPTAASRSSRVQGKGAQSVAHAACCAGNIHTPADGASVAITLINAFCTCSPVSGRYGCLECCRRLQSRSLRQCWPCWRLALQVCRTAQAHPHEQGTPAVHRGKGACMSS